MTNASTPSGLDLLRIPNVQGWNDDNPGLQHDNSYVAIRAVRDWKGKRTFLLIIYSGTRNAVRVTCVKEDGLYPCLHQSLPGKNDAVSGAALRTGSNKG